MAYGEKYYHEYCDRYGDTYRISLQEEGYTGLSTEVECGYEQFLIEQESSEVLLIGGVRPTRATATFVSSGAFDLQEIYTGTERTYLLVRYKNGNLNWQGNVPSEGFSQSNWDAKHIQLTVKATDNLSGLKSEPFTDALGENYGNDGNNIQTFLWAIKEGLKKTGFNMNIWTFVDLKPMVQSGTRTYSAKIERISSNQIRLYFSDSGKFIEFINITQPGDIINTPSGAGEILSYTSYSSLFTYYATVTVDVNVPTFTPYNTIVVVSPPPSTPIGDPLYHTQHDVRVWIRDSDIEGKTYYEARGGAMDTWSVLDAIARQWHLRIYQNNGHWEVKRINADKLDLSEHQWFVYNSEGTFLRRENFSVTMELPCSPSDTKYRIFGTVLSMDRVFKNVIVNYRYKYKQDGDTLKNLIENPNFVPNIYEKWTIMKDSRTPGISVTPYSGSIPLSNIGTAVTIKNIYPSHFLANRQAHLKPNLIRQVNKGDRLNISWWEKVDGSVPQTTEDRLVTMYIFGLWGGATYEASASNELLYDLVTSSWDVGIPGNINGVDVQYQVLEGEWRRKGKEESHTFFGVNQEMNYSSVIKKGVWKKVTVTTNECPIDGWITCEIYGAAPVFVHNVLPVSAIEKFNLSVNKMFMYYIRRTVLGDGTIGLKRVNTVMSVDYTPHYELTVTGMQMGKIVDPDNDVVPQIDPFMYPDQQAQLTREFSDTISEVEVLTGDDYGQYQEDRISGMSWEGTPTQFWDTWDERFGWSRQGLITAKSIMENYWKPTRLIQCEIGVKGFDWSTLIEFEELPGLRFAVLRGSIGGNDSTFRGTLKEVFGDLEQPLPPGGQDGGNTTIPNWQPTGIVRCVKDVDTGLNTGRSERVEVDTNQASPTYGQERWVDAGEDLTTCPIGEPLEILWGEQLVLDIDNLRSYPYGKIDDTYSVDYSNDGSDRYLRLVHRSDLGVVRSITYSGGFENISGWEYEADVVIEGYTYKSMKLTWFVGIFENLNVNFVIN